MNVPNKYAMDAITECFCKIYREYKGGVGCLDCPLHKIKSKCGSSICSFYAGDSDQRMSLLQACIKHGNAEMFKDLPPGYRAYLVRTVTVV